MKAEVFARLIAQIRALGAADSDLATDGMPRAIDRVRGHENDAPPTAPIVDPIDLHRATGALLAALAARVETELTRVLALSWDQIDSLVLLDRELATEARRLRAAARHLSDTDGDLDSTARAEGLACALMLDAAVGLATMVERRLAALVRLRGTQPLLVEGRPFLDLAPVLRETARAWGAA